MPERSVMLGGAHISKAVSDDSFFRTMPEFMPIKAKISAMHADMSSKSGCAPCRQKRVRANIEADFASIASSLTPDGAARLKRYFCEDRMTVFARNPRTGNAYVKEL